MTGWIRIERALWDHDAFAREPMSEREAWAWMIAQAAWDDTRHRVGQVLLKVPRGTFMTTLRELQSAFMWRSEKRVRTFLALLENEGMIGRSIVGERNARKTHVTICNYDKYQDGGRSADAAKTHHGRSKDAVKEQDNNKQPSEAKASSVDHAANDTGFDAFWGIWPNKTAKHAAKKAWQKLPLDDKRAAYAAVKAGWFTSWQAQHPDASPLHPATFINQRRWEDQPAKPRFSQQGPTRAAFVPPDLLEQRRQWFEQIQAEAYADAGPVDKSRRAGATT